MTTLFNKIRKEKIPACNPYIRLKNGFREHPMCKQRKESPLIELSNRGIAGKNHYYSNFNPPYYKSIPEASKNLLVRKSIAARLLKVNDYLKKFGLELWIFDAWRPIAI